MHKRGKKRAVATLVAVVLIILLTVPLIVFLWDMVIPYIKNTFLVDMSAVELSIIPGGGYTAWDSSSGLVALQVLRGDDDIELEHIYVIISLGGNSYSYLLPAMDKNSVRTYYFGEIFLEPSNIKVFASIPLVKKNKLSANAYLPEIQKAGLNEKKIVDEGHFIYLLDGSIKSFDCRIKFLGGYINAPENTECSNRRFCDNFGNCVGCLNNKNCVSPSMCFIGVCKTDNERCDYSGIINDCGSADGCCVGGCGDPDCNPVCQNGDREGDYGSDKYEECDKNDLDGKTCQDLGFFEGDLKCTIDCKIDNSLCKDYVIEVSDESWVECADNSRRMGDDDANFKIGLTTNPSLSWNIKFYNEIYDKIYIDSNGKINFGSSVSDVPPINSNHYFKKFIAPLWMDLSDEEGRNSIYYCNNENHIVIRWNTKAKNTDYLEDFEVKIYENGEIYFVYKNIFANTLESFYGVFPGNGETYSGKAEAPKSRAYKLTYSV